LIKLIVAGSRSFNDYELLKSKLDYFLSEVTGKIEIVSGTCHGADKLGERYALECGYAIKRFAADWAIGKTAGFVRNEQMAAYSTHLVAFHDGVSKGTLMMIRLAKSRGLKIRVVRI